MKIMHENWETRSLGDCAKFVSGGTPSKRKPEFWGYVVPSDVFREVGEFEAVAAFLSEER